MDTLYIVNLVINNFFFGSLEKDQQDTTEKNVNSANWECNKNKFKKVSGENGITIKLNQETKRYDKSCKGIKKIWITAVCQKNQNGFIAKPFQMQTDSQFVTICDENQIEMEKNI